MHVKVMKIVLACNNDQITSICKNIEFKISAGLLGKRRKKFVKKLAVALAT